MDRLTEHAQRNRAFWNELSDTYQADHGPDLARHGAAWGVWQIPEDEIHALDNVVGRDVLELGCGAAQWSIGLARRGAHVVGLDLSRGQLSHARTLIAGSGPTVRRGARRTRLSRAGQSGIIGQTSHEHIACARQGR